MEITKKNSIKSIHTQELADNSTSESMLRPNYLEPAGISGGG